MDKDVLSYFWEKIKALVNTKASNNHSHSYDDLSDKPTIPTNTNQLDNGAGFITSSGTAKTISDVLPTSLGGTGATDVKTARTNLGITPSNIGALKHASITMVGLGFTAKSTVTVKDFLIALRTKIGVNSAQVDIKWSSANGATVSDGTNSVLIEGGVLYTTGSGNILSGTWATYTAIYFHQSSSTFYKFSISVSATAGTYTTSMKKYLSSDNTTYSVATTSKNGLMSATDKSRLDTIYALIGSGDLDGGTP